MPVIDPNGTSMVQVAAVSHQEDADTLIVALKKRGYTVFIRQEPKDKLFHVQLGPFATKKDADAMRQHLLADGYNAIVK
jgi:cell division septation protein DedD